MSDYIMGLREIVGHRPLLQVGASVILVNAQGHVLLQKRTDNHCWGYPGGSVELDEPIEEAASRELFEETGLIADVLTFYGVFSGPDYHYIYPNGDEVSNIDVVFLCRKYSGNLCPQPDETEELAFFAPDALPVPLSPPIQKILLRWAEEQKKSNFAPNGYTYRQQGDST